MELVKLPVPSPSVVILLLIVGFKSVPQHTPLAETIAMPSEVTLPPLINDVEVIFVKGVVYNSGSVKGFSSSQLVVKINTDPIINNEKNQNLYSLSIFI